MGGLQMVGLGTTMISLSKIFREAVFYVIFFSRPEERVQGVAPLFFGAHGALPTLPLAAAVSDSIESSSAG
jgi:hypothetical protein